MANTFPATLVSELVHDVAITTLGPVLGAVNAFAFDVDPDPLSPGSTVKVGVVTATSASTTNPTNYETGDSTKEQRDVVVDEHSKSFHVTQAQLNKGHSLKQLIRKNMQTVANAARDAVFAPLTVANYGAAILDVTAAAFVPGDLQGIWASCKDFPTKNLLIDGAYYSKLLPTNAESFLPGATGAFGFDSIAPNNRWDGAGTDVIGFCGTTDSLVIASGEPVMDSGLENLLDDYMEVPLDGGLSVYVASWVSLATRTRWMSIGLMLGAAKGDVTAGKLITDGV